MDTETTTQKAKNVHHGRNVKCFRDYKRMTQEVLADEIGVSQQTISKIESQEVVDDEMLSKIAAALSVTVDTIKNFENETAVSIFSNTFNEQSIAYQYNFNPINKIVELYEGQIVLYERMLKSEQEKSAVYEKLLKEK